MNKKRVVIDAERLRQPYSGLGQVALQLGREFLNSPCDDWEPAFLLPKDCLNIFGPDAHTHACSNRQRYFRRLSPACDLWHVLHQDARYMPRAGTPYVLTIHDLNFLPEKTDAKAQKRLTRVQRLVDGAAAVTAISAYTSDVVKQHLEFGDTPLEVVYNGLCLAPGVIARKPEHCPEGEFLFSMGVIRPKKNFHVLLELVSRLNDVNLLIAGNIKGEYSDQIIKRAARLGLDQRVVLLGEVTEKEKIWLLEHCKAFVFPSLYEGFGLPLIEAMSFGKPTFSSNLASLPEVGGNDVCYWESFDPNHMLDVFSRGMQAFEREPERAERLKCRAEQFSWQRAARQYADIYTGLLS